MPIENEQPVTGQSFFYLEICCRLVAEKFGKLPISSWTNRDYIRLSGILMHQTSVTLSASTLKRIFGKLKTPDRYYPQKATRDALASYAGYKNWEELVQQQQQKDDTHVAHQLEQVVNFTSDRPSPPESTPDLPFQKTTLLRRFTGWIILVAVLITAAYFLFRLSNQPSSRPDKASIGFHCINPEGETPHTANFSLQMKSGWDERRQLFIDYGDGRHMEAVGNRTNFSHYYETPGRYFCILKYGAEPIDTAIVYLKSNGWTATGHMPRDTTRVYPIEIGNATVNPQALDANILQALHAGIDTTNTFFIDYDYVTPTAINGDNFELMADVITSAQRPGVRCSQLSVIVFGEKSVINFRVIKPGCEQWLTLQLSERYNNAIAPDLSFLDADLSKGGQVKLKVAGKKVSIYINDKCVLTDGYNLSLQKVYGVSIGFSGIGSIRSFHLSDNQTKTIFPGSFE